MPKKRPSHIRPDHSHVEELMLRHVRGKDPLCEAWALVAAGVASGDQVRCSELLKEAVRLGVARSDVARAVLDTDTRHGALACLSSGVVRKGRETDEALSLCLSTDRPRAFLALGGDNGFRTSLQNRHRPEGPDMPASFWAAEKGSFNTLCALLDKKPTQAELLCALAGALSWAGEGDRGVGKRLLFSSKILSMLEDPLTPMPDVPGMATSMGDSKHGIPNPEFSVRNGDSSGLRDDLMSLLQAPAFAIPWICSGSGDSNPKMASKAFVSAVTHLAKKFPMEGYLPISPAAVALRHPSCGRVAYRRGVCSVFGMAVLESLKRLPLAAIGGTGPGSCLAAALDGASLERTLPFSHLAQALASKGFRPDTGKLSSMIAAAASSICHERPGSPGSFPSSKILSERWEAFCREVLVPASPLMGKASDGFLKSLAEGGKGLLSRKEPFDKVFEGEWICMVEESCLSLCPQPTLSEPCPNVSVTPSV